MALDTSTKNTLSLDAEARITLLGGAVSDLQKVYPTYAPVLDFFRNEVVHSDSDPSYRLDGFTTPVIDSLVDLFRHVARTIAPKSREKEVIQMDFRDVERMRQETLYQVWIVLATMNTLLNEQYDRMIGKPSPGDMHGHQWKIDTAKQKTLLWERYLHFEHSVRSFGYDTGYQEDHVGLSLIGGATDMLFHTSAPELGLQAYLHVLYGDLPALSAAKDASVLSQAEIIQRTTHCVGAMLERSAVVPRSNDTCAYLLDGIRMSESNHCVPSLSLARTTCSTIIRQAHRELLQRSSLYHSCTVPSDTMATDAF